MCVARFRNKLFEALKMTCESILFTFATMRCSLSLAHTRIVCVVISFWGYLSSVEKCKHVILIWSVKYSAFVEISSKMRTSLSREQNSDGPNEERHQTVFEWTSKRFVPHERHTYVPVCMCVARTKKWTQFKRKNLWKLQKNARG